MEKGWPEGSEDFDLRIQSGSDLETVQWGRTMLFSVTTALPADRKKCWVIIFRVTRGVTTDRWGQGRNKQKRYVGGVTTEGGQGRNKQKRNVVRI